MLANATNNAVRLGGADVGISGAGTAAGGESGGMVWDLERRLGIANPIRRVPKFKEWFRFRSVFLNDWTSFLVLTRFLDVNRSPFR